MAKVNVPQSATAGTLSVEPELRMEFAAPMYASYCGTRLQLIELGIISSDQQFPQKTWAVNWRNGAFSYCLKRKRIPGTTGPWVNIDYWILRVRDDRYTWDDVWERELRAKRAAANARAGRELERFIEKAMAAKADVKFQGLIAAVCGF